MLTRKKSFGKDVHCMEVGVADTGVLDIYEDLIWARLLNYIIISPGSEREERLGSPGICLYSTGPPVFSMTCAHCFSGMLGDILYIVVD